MILRLVLPFPMRLRIAITAVLVLTVGVAYFLSGSRAAVVVQTAAAQSHAIAPTILASGTLVYDTQITLGSELLGRVEAVLVREGDEVRKGQILARLDDEAPRTEVQQQQAAREQARINIDRLRIQRDAAATRAGRYQNLVAQGLVEATKYEELISQRDVAEAEWRNGRAALEQAAAQVEQSRQRLARTSIRSPIDGRVIQVTIRPGETAVPSAMSIAGGSLMVIADTRRLYAEVNVDEVDIARVAVGQSAVVVPVAFPDAPMDGRVERVAVSPRQPAGQGRSYAVRVRLDEAYASKFRPGMGARVQIATRTAGAVHPVVPLQAVVYGEETLELKREAGSGPASVFVLSNGRAEKRPVETGASDDSSIEIRRGLRANEQVVIGPARTLRSLRDGDAVQAAPANPESNPS